MFSCCKLTKKYTIGTVPSVFFCVPLPSMRKIIFLTAFVLGLLTTAGAIAQTDSIRTGLIKSVGRTLDTRAHLKYDPQYIEVPDRPWRVILRGKMDENIVDFINSNSVLYEGSKLDTRFTLKFDTKLNKSIGLWVGYRGLGFGYYYKPDKKPDINIAVSATAAKFGLNFRLRSRQTNTLHFALEQSDGDTAAYDEMDAVLKTYIDIKSLYLNAYYVFNGRRYSQGAAYNQVVIQRKSAGSLLLGLTAYGSSVDVATSDLNAGVIAVADSVGYLSLGKISVGLGYGYNWVPARGLTINAMVMPNLSLYDNIIRKKFDCNYDYPGVDIVDDYGKWDSEKRQWENGKQRKPLIINDTYSDWQNDVEMWETRTERRRTSMAFNVDVRMGVAYCWKRYFVSANAIFEHYNYGRDRNKVDLIDWYATFSLGIRL